MLIPSDFSFFCALLNKQSRSKCLPKTEHCTQTHGLFVNSTQSNKNYQNEETFIQTPITTNIGFYQTQIRTDRLLSEANSLNLFQIPTYTMTKTMDSFSDAHNNTAIQNSMIGFDDLMTPIIGKF